MDRQQYEKRVLGVMIALYCKNKHNTSKMLCAQCQELLEYGITKIERCPLDDNKTTCDSCTIHCYKPLQREQIRVAMRYSGPRMILHHPVMALRHLMKRKK